jgi:hypothetical protein
MQHHRGTDQSRLTLIAVALVLGGCGMAPKNADEFRQATRDGVRLGLTSVESFEVDRSLREVSSTLQRKATECLTVSVNWNATNAYGNTRSGVHRYKPTFVANADKAELHVQRKRSGGGDVDVGAPADGFYDLVVDAIPVSPKRTRIEIYQGDKLMRTALRGWTTGNNLGCPDLTKR